MIRSTSPRHVNATWRMSPSVSPRGNLAGIFPDQHRLRENSRSIIETDPAFAQGLGVLCLIPLKLHRE
jgi:hypothetical protein